MRSLSSVGLGLSVVFGCLFLALVAELYYLLWWKRRIPNRLSIEDGYSSSTETAAAAAKESLNMFCGKKPSSLGSAILKLNPQHICSSHETLVHEPQAQHRHGNSDKEDAWSYGEESVEAELMRVHNFSGPPRFLFTIKEETKEDLESDDGKSRGERSRKGSRSKSLSDLFHILETPFLTPLGSPPYYTPPLTPKKPLYNGQLGFNSFFESVSEAEFNLLRASPPPVFQFLKDAEDKLWRRKTTVTEQIDEENIVQRIGDDPSSSTFVSDEESESFITLFVNKRGELQNDEHDENVVQFPSKSNTSQVLPLASSPPTFKLTYDNKFNMNQMIQRIQ